MTGRGGRAARYAAARPRIEALTFDFGNTLVPVDRASLDRVVAALAAAAAARLAVDRAAFLVAWTEERARQLAEDVPRLREVDLSIRLGRVLARLRGMPAPARGAAWDEQAAARHSTPDEIAFALDVYSRAFVDALPPDPAVTALLRRLSGRYRLAILSNWPLAATIDRYAEAAGWLPHLAGTVVSERVGTIKPDPAIFRAAEATLAATGVVPPPGGILHIGDDWAADVVGAKAAGWQAAWLRARPADSPLPGSQPDGTVVPDIVIDRLAELEPALLEAAPTAPATAAAARERGRAAGA